MTTNQLRYWELQELARSNRARETETNRHNVRAEQHTEFQNLETQRSNLVKEGETFQANRAKEIETSRHQKAMEQLEASKLAETIRNNTATLAETTRANKEREFENERSNKASERLTKRGQNNATAQTILKGIIGWIS